MAFIDECMNRTLQIDKEDGGASWYVCIGIVGSPFFKRVGGLSRKQADGLSEIFREVNESSVRATQFAVKDALGITQRWEPSR